MSDRPCATDNPLGLMLGERIKIQRTCLVQRSGIFRHLTRQETSPRECVVIGCARYALGQYVYREPIHPPVFHENWSNWLYECRDSMCGESFLVHPEDVIL